MDPQGGSRQRIHRNARSRPVSRPSSLTVSNVASIPRVAEPANDQEPVLGSGSLKQPFAEPNSRYRSLDWKSGGYRASGLVRFSPMAISRSLILVNRPVADFGKVALGVRQAVPSTDIQERQL